MTEKSYTDLRCEQISENIKRIRNEIAEAAIKSGRRPEDVRLMAVTKTVDTCFINHAISECGIDLIGENKVQEFLSKEDELLPCEAHLIGHLQTNKVKQIVGRVKCIQSVDSVKVAKEISKQSVLKNVNTDILLEVNIGHDDAKFGISPESLDEIIDEIAELESITVRGLMTIPPICDDIVKTQRFFENMYRLFLDIQAKKSDNVRVSVLSQGMSADYVPAILAGSNLVRVGSAIFGDRTY